LEEQKLEILYNGCYCGENLFNIILKSQDVPMSYAQEKLEKMLFKGFNINDCSKITAISSVPVRAYPGNKKIFWCFKKVNLEKNILLKQLPFLNFLIIKQIMIMFGSFIETLKWVTRNWKNKNKVMLSYSANPPVLIPMLFLCKLFKIKSVIIVTEIPKFRLFNGQTSMIRSVLLKVMLKVSEWLHESFDGYIMMTEYMNEQINKKKKPYVVVEGMVDVDEYKNGEEAINKKKKMILYSGTLDYQYGIHTLIKSFKMVDIPDTTLSICGQGNYKKEIGVIANECKKINYLGMLSYIQVSRLQHEAGFLINPRPSNSEFTRYSFPSKTLEYLLSGTPVISTRLVGIPKEYDKYLIYIEDETEQGYKKQLESILSDNYDRYEGNAKKGREFVLREKNLKAQTGVILGFFIKLLSNNDIERNG